MAIVNAPLNQNDIKLICYGTIMVTGPDYPDVFSTPDTSDVDDYTLIGTHKFSNITGLKYVWGEFDGITYGFSLKEGGNPTPVTQSIWVHSKEAGDKNFSASGKRLDILLAYEYTDWEGGIKSAAWTFLNVDPVEADVIDFTVPAKRNGRKPLTLKFWVRNSV